MIRMKDGYTRVTSKAGITLIIADSEYLRILGEWHQGAAFAICKEFYGGEVGIKLGEVFAIFQVTPEAYEASRRDDNEMDKESTLYNA